MQYQQCAPAAAAQGCRAGKQDEFRPAVVIKVLLGNREISGDDFTSRKSPVQLGAHLVGPGSKLHRAANRELFRCLGKCRAHHEQRQDRGRYPEGSCESV